MQIVNIFLSIVRKPKRFLFCMFLFVVKWWEIPLEGSLVAGRWRTVIRDFNVQEPRTVVFRVKPNIWKSFPHPLWLSPRKEFGCLSWFVVDVKTLPSAFQRRDESHILLSSSWTSTFLKDFPFAREQTLWRLNANKPIVVNIFKRFFLSAGEGFRNNN